LLKKFPPLEHTFELFCLHLLIKASTLSTTHKSITLILLGKAFKAHSRVAPYENILFSCSEKMVYDAARFMAHDLWQNMQLQVHTLKTLLEKHKSEF
jgi:hypothetical protein